MKLGTRRWLIGERRIQHRVSIVAEAANCHHPTCVATRRRLRRCLSQSRHDRRQRNLLDRPSPVPARSRSRSLTRWCRPTPRRSSRCCAHYGGPHDYGWNRPAGSRGNASRGLPQTGGRPGGDRAGSTRWRSVLRRGLCVPLQEAGPGEAVVVGRHRHLSDDETARERAVSLAADRRRDDEAVGGAALRAARRRRVGARGAPGSYSTECYSGLCSARCTGRRWM